MSLEFKRAFSIDIPNEGGGGSVNNQDITVTSNGVYTAESGYSGLGEVTVSVPDYVTSGLPVILGNIITTVEVGE